MSPYAVRKKSRMRFVKFARVGIRQIEDESAYSWALFESWFEMVRHSSVTSSAASHRFDAVAQVIRHRSCSYCSSSSNRFPLLQTSKNQFRRKKKPFALVRSEHSHGIETSFESIHVMTDEGEESTVEACFCWIDMEFEETICQGRRN